MKKEYKKIRLTVLGLCVGMSIWASRAVAQILTEVDSINGRTLYPVISCNTFYGNTNVVATKEI